MAPGGVAADPLEVLLTTAELSFALAGFSGVVIIFIRRADTPWNTLDLLRFWTLMGYAAGALLFSLLPLPFLSFGLAPDSLWGPASAVQGLFMAGAAITHLWPLSLSRPGSWLIFVAVTLGSSLSAVILLLNAAGLVFQQSFSAYLIGVIWMFLAGGTMFLRAIYAGLHARS
jgi:hypothetical protein